MADVAEGDSLEVEELVGNDETEEVLVDVEAVRSVTAMAASAPLPATGVPSGRVKGEPTSHTGWSWPGERTRELQQYELTPEVLLRRMIKHPLDGWADVFGQSTTL